MSTFLKRKAEYRPKNYPPKSSRLGNLSRLMTLENGESVGFETVMHQYNLTPLMKIKESGSGAQSKNTRASVAISAMVLISTP